MLKVSQVSLQHRLNDLSVEMHAGECWHILGQNGAGKSSLFDAIAGLVDIEKGTIEINNSSISHISLAELSAKLTYLQQQYSLSFALKVQEILSFYTGNTVIPMQIENALSLTPLLSRTFNSLSGGEQQRVHIARCMMQVWQSIQRGEALILLDEPIQSLDVAYQEKALSLFKHIASMGNLVVLSIHDVNLSLRFCDHVLMLKNNKNYRCGKAAEIMTSENITNLYDYPFTELVNQHSVEKIFIRSPL